MAALAKLSRPRTAGVYPRERLFARLDECLRHPAVWISGPPGAGKTTLAASYLEARGLRSLWYQVDEGDTDPASFFYFLGQGARAAGVSKKVHLPLLTPEYMPDLPGFTRRYFRSLCQALPQPCVLVLDNVHEAPAASPFNAVIRDALGELPQGTNAILVSRTAPPAVNARLRASLGLTELSWDELRLTDDEAMHIAMNAHAAPLPGIGTLVKRCGGWAAGLRLLLNHARATGGVADAPESRQALFDYFAAELFDRLPPATQHLLLRTALLPWVSVEMAQALSLNRDAGVLLEGLRREHLFTDSRSGPGPSYQYHALFREFLAARVQQVCTAEEQAQLARDSAHLLAHAGEAGAALPLYLSVSDHEHAVQLVLAEAPRLAAQGRLQTLGEWIGALPAPLLHAVPWLAYWLGMCEFGPNLVAARTRLEGAYLRFGEVGDALGQALAAADVIETHNFEFRDMSRLDPWVAQLHGVLAKEPAFPDPALELHVLGALVTAQVMRKPLRHLLDPTVAKMRRLMDAVDDPNRRIDAACRLLHFYVFVQETHAGRLLIATLRPALNDPRISAHNRCSWLHLESLFFQLCAYDSAQACAAIDSALAIVAHEGLHFWTLLLQGRAAMVKLDVPDVAAAEKHLAAVPLDFDVVRYDMAFCIGLHAWLAMLRGDPETAVRYATHQTEVCAQTGTGPAYGMALIWKANALAAAGEVSGALACLRVFRDERLMPTPFGEFSADLVEADLHLAEGRETQAVALLREAMQKGRRERIFNSMQWLAPQMSRLCALALEHDIESAYVTELIRVRRLAPPAPQTRVWPWPVKIHTLGRFEIRADDAPLRFEGKAQHKPLALLKALIALGGNDVAEDKLIDIVWPDERDGDAQKTFDVTLHRLRKLLGNDAALRVSDRRVSLNREVVWVDLWALERELGGVIPVQHASVVDAAELERAAPAVLDLYRGHFLHDEPDAAWLLPVRNRLNGRFERFVMRLGDHWEAAAQWPRAAELFERAVELDPLAETFYRRWMVCLGQQGRRAEAIDVFRRCRQILSVTLGVKPAEATEAVYRELLGS